MAIRLVSNSKNNCLQEKEICADEDTERKAHGDTGSRPPSISQGKRSERKPANPTDTLMVRISASRVVQKQFFCCLRLIVCGTLLWLPKLMLGSLGNVVLLYVE